MVSWPVRDVADVVRPLTHSSASDVDGSVSGQRVRTSGRVSEDDGCVCVAVGVAVVGVQQRDGHASPSLPPPPEGGRKKYR